MTRHSARDAVLLSACMIVRDEEARLGACLDSLAASIDEIIVVDTGSVDRTADVARRHGAHLFTFNWTDDFSAARNESLRHAHGRWILWIDADEQLQEQEQGALRRLCDSASPETLGYWVHVSCPYGDDNSLEISADQWRLFRNNAGIRFRHRIHEQPEPPGFISPDRVPAQSGVWLLHDGYLPEGDHLERKMRRNRRILELALADDPDEPFHHFNLGRQLVREGAPAEGLQHLEHAIELWTVSHRPAPLYSHLMFSFAAQAAVELSRLDRVLQLEESAPPAAISTELLCQTAIAYWRLGRTAEAIDRLNRAISDPSLIKPGGHDLASSTWLPRTLLAQIRGEMGDTDAALDLAQQALAFAPEQAQIQLLAAHLAAKAGQVMSAVSLLRKVAASGNAQLESQARRLLLTIADSLDDARLVLEAVDGPVESISGADQALIRAAAAERLDDPGLQLKALQEGCHHFPDDSRLHLALARLLAASGQLEDARQALAAYQELAAR